MITQPLPFYDIDLPYEHGSAKIILDSINEDGNRVTTFEGNLWKLMNAELNTHRDKSRSGASSRAIPLRRANRRGTLDLIEDHPLYPLFWGGEKSGMQPGEELSAEDIALCREEWDLARTEAIVHAEAMAELGLHKSLINRTLEPFMWYRVILTGTNWQNMFNQRSNLRTDKVAPEFGALCTNLELLLDASVPQELDHGEWHLPYILPDEKDQEEDVLKSISGGRCARVSYLNHDLIKDPDDDVRFCRKLISETPMHVAPFEHVCTPDRPGEIHMGNLSGYRQWRHDIELSKGVNSRL